MAGGGHDSGQWLSVTEDTLFLHDGLLRVTDLVELPHDVTTLPDGDSEVVSFDAKSPTELCEKLLSVCGTHNNAYTRLLEYRLNALRAYWHAQQQIAIEEQNDRDNTSQEETIALLKKQGLLRENEQSSFSTRVSLLLVLPLLQSQSKLDPSLCGMTAQLLLNCLRDCAPLSLSKEPSDCLNGLESLLSSWLGEKDETKGTSEVKAITDQNQRENAASSLVALACARGHLKTFIHTVHLLQGLPDLHQLPVADILQKLLEVEGGAGQPTALMGSKHIVCWGLEDMLTVPEKKAVQAASGAAGGQQTGANQAERNKDKEGTVELDPGRSITCDGKFLYTTNSSGKGAAKVGTGLHGTLRGYVYTKNTELPAGCLAWGDGILLHRPLEYDSENDIVNMAQILDPYTLKPVKILPKPDAYLSQDRRTTIALCGDGSYFYWFWSLGNPADKNTKGQALQMDAFRIDQEHVVIPLKPTIVLQKKEDGSTKTLNETLLSRLRPYRSAATAATLVALTGGEPAPPKKDEANTSCGLPLKTLLRTPIFCDGTTVVLLAAVPGGSTSGVARSLFGGGTGLASLRSLAMNTCFSVSDGQFITKSDLVDAPTCALARGASVLGLGACFDNINNMIWTCSNDWVDQFFNPGHQARHHIFTRLGLDPLETLTTPEDNMLSTGAVIEQLLQHVGSMCLHQVQSDLLQVPLGSLLLQQQPVDLAYMERACDILEKAVKEHNRCIIVCTLVIFQLIFKVSSFKGEQEKEKLLLERTKTLIWRILDEYCSGSDREDSSIKAIQEEVCSVLSAGLGFMYRDPLQKRNLLHRLLTDGEKVPGLARLQDIILVECAERLKIQIVDDVEIKNQRLPDDLVQLILKVTVRESCQLLRQCQTADRTKFDGTVATVPLASPTLQYLMALQSSLLRESVLYQEEDDQDKKDGHTSKNKSLQEIQLSVLCLASKIFNAAYEVLEVLLETCNSMINSGYEDLEYRLQGLERVCKATILGHLVPLLVTSMTHYNLRCLPIADTIMPQLVHLVLLTSQAALLLKSQVQAIQQDELLDINTDTDIVELIAESLNLESFESEEKEEGFLAGLKIPAPWATGKSVESIHPVRDNYKYKETVQIPGARCLYLRFDGRCSSQYDYDKLVIYAGPNTGSKKVAEYGGNTFGYGSRSVLGSGWPKDLVKVEGDTVTLSFEMRSGREHNTPDKAMWGFLVTVRAQESTEEVSNGLPFLADLALGLSVLACTMLHLLYHGPEKTQEEIACTDLLKARLLQRCVWQIDQCNVITPLQTPSPVDIAISDEMSQHAPPLSPTKLPRIRLPVEIVNKLRELSDRRIPAMRPSIGEVLKPELMEESILSAVIKHLSLSDVVRNITEHEEHSTEEFFLLGNVLSELYRKLNAMIRQLQSLAELEHKWKVEVDDIKQGVMQAYEVFFADYHLLEDKDKELSILCFLKEIDMEDCSAEEIVNSLREKIDVEVQTEKAEAEVTLAKTKMVVEGLIERLNLLLHVTMAPEGTMSRSVSIQNPDTHKIIPTLMVRSDTDMLKPMYARSLSAPSEIQAAQDDSIIDIMKLQKKRQAHRKVPTILLQDLVTDEGRDRPPHVILLDQLFTFIGSNPEKAVSCKSFLAAAKTRWKRGATRQQALKHMKELLTAASRVGGATHLVAAVTSVLQHGPRTEELTCGGMVDQVREAFVETMTSVVQLAARYPIACCNSIGLLCTIPYTKAEEKCLVRSGLVHLLDKLCNLSSCRIDSSNTDSQSTKQKVSTMAWAGFQVLSNRCVTWEQEDVSTVEELEHSGLARQVSVLLTNHLARATACSGNEAAGSEALQEVLSLLNNLSRSQMGKAILSQPGCVSKLLSLLLDQRPSPKLVLIILQLCRVALPLMNADDCDKVELPTWGQDIHDLHGGESASEKSLRIASLLLAKLGDFLVPGGVTTVSSRRPSTEMLNTGNSNSGDKDKDDGNIHDGRLSIFVHKRDDQSSHEVIQPLLSSDNRPFRLSGGANMERVVRMDREMTKTGKAEITTEDAVSALRRAAKWAQMGLVVSTGQPIEQTTETASTGGDKKKATAENVCKDKNTELSRTDPVRPFISGHVANSMAAEVIALLHSLLTAPETHTAQLWSSAVEIVITKALSCLPVLMQSLDDLGTGRGDQNMLMAMAKQADAALAALGGFEETIKPGCQVMITGPGVENCVGQVLTVSEQTGLATVSLQPPSDEDFTPIRYSENVQVPLSRLKPPRNKPLPMHQLSMSESIVTAVQSLLLPQGGGCCPLTQHLVLQGDGNALVNQICRVVAEVRTRACKVLACHLQDMSFASAFIQHSSASIDILKSLSKDCSSGDRENVTVAQCQRLRMLYRDCAKPPPPPIKSIDRPAKEITWDTKRTFPPLRSCLFSHSVTAVTFLGDPSVGSGLPRGTIVYSTQAIPNQAPSFYWELEISSFGDSQEEGGPTISFGFMPAAEKKDGAWTYPVGTCLFHNNGRSVHYNGSSLLQWRSIRLEVSLNSGDVAGIGWERQGDTPPLPGQTVKGSVYFTHNGRRLNGALEEVSGAMWPVVHIQKKNTSIRANFGSRPFAYAEGRHHRNAADECNDITQEIKENFGALPFNFGSDSDSEGPVSVSTSTTDTASRDLKSPPWPSCKVATVPKSLREYNPEGSVLYRRRPCYENFTVSGPDTVSQQANQDDESDVEEVEDDQSNEDHYALLVKAWEQKVFPTIRRRFRNEAERKDGLEQIRGALQLGMVDIARQTVEFLYEENCDIPRDLHLPTIEDIREELAKFTIERVRKGAAVVIRTPNSANTYSMVLPKFAVRGMVKTFSLTGVVLDIDQPNELVQVETYLRSEGVLVRYWYPLDMLERPPQGYSKSSSIIGQPVIDTSNPHIHRELLRVESVLAHMYCRSALLELISQCNSPSMEITNSANLGSAMAASAALLQELDLENLQLLSNELSACPQPHGGVAASSLLTAQSAMQCMVGGACCASDVLYREPEKLKEELKIAIGRAANQGEDYLIELSNQICMCMQTAPETFPYEEFPVNETKVTTDLHFPEAAFLIVSCKADPKAARKDTSLYKAPWARIFTYRGHRVKKVGQASKQEVVSYPRDTSSSSTGSSQFAPVIIPADLVHVKIGVSPPPGYIVTIHAIPPQFPLAIAYIETLITTEYGFQYRNADSESGKATEVPSCSSMKSGYDSTESAPWRTFERVVVTPTVLLQVSELICGFIWRTPLPALMKEYMFHLLAQTLRMLKQAESGISNIFPTLSPQFSPALALLTQLQAELQKLFEEETKGWNTVTTAAGTGIGLGVSDQGRFSTYFHSLMEACLAIAEVTSLNAAGGPPTTPAADASQAPTSPVSAGKRKKLKTKRERDRTSSGSKRSASPRRTSDGDGAQASSSGSSVQASSSGTSTSSSSTTVSTGKADDLIWFQRASTMSHILRHIMYKDPIGKGVTDDAVSDAFDALVTPTAHSRLLILRGLPSKLDEQTAKQAIRKACSTCGGLYKDEIYLPLMDLKKSGKLKTKASSSPPRTDVETAKHLAEALAEEGMSGSVDSGNQSEMATTSDPPKQILKGYAVIELRSKCKFENAKKALTKSKMLVSGPNFDPGELVDVPDEMLSLSAVNQNLFSEEESANEALESYLYHKLVGDKEEIELSDSSIIALTEIFHSTFINEHRSSPTDRQDTGGYICLTKEQICTQATGNLLFMFLGNVKPSKKSLPDHVGLVLKKYGLPKMSDKEESDRPDRHKPIKKPSRPSKERMVVGATASKTSAKDKKPKIKEPSEKAGREEAASDPVAKSSKESLKEAERVLTLDGFLSYVSDQVRQDVRSVWRALLASGFDLHFERSACLDVSQAQQMASQWSVEMDTALVHYVNKLCRHLAISASRLQPHEIYMSEAELSSAQYSCLAGVPIESLRLRFSFLQSINNTLETFFLPLVDVRPVLSKIFSRSTANLLSATRGLIFHDVKTILMNRILNATAQRKPDQAAPEITLDPLENVGGDKKKPCNTNLCQALRQLSGISSSQLCVRLAAGGDPTYAFNVRMMGEEVHGTSGSFRHFLWQVSQELQSGTVGLLVPCPSSASHRNRGKYILRPGPMSYAEEKLLLFLGQLLGTTVRADIPLGLDLLPVFWKNLVGVELDPVTDLQEADIMTYNYLKKFEMAESEHDLHLLVGDSAPKFTYQSIGGGDVELIPNGRNVTVNWENRQVYIDAIRLQRMKELQCKERTQILIAGMATVLPPQLLSLLSPLDAELRISGTPHVDLDFLKAHTMYQVGLVETDTHIEYFWNALEGFSQDDLCRFIKFACNQERIPMICPCRDGSDTSHVPPYPMKIAPPDGSGPPDSRFVRVETCMFMIKLPQYSSQEVMTQKLLYAINCREDPLSG